jgi:hypothetical protein
VTWLEIGVWALVLDRGFSALLGFIAGARAAYRGACDTSYYDAPTDTVPGYVEVASDDAVSLDYSSGTKRH